MATRTWVSGVGDDANPGSRTAPCKTFAGAMSKTDPGGEINVTDPGGFGPVTITKSLTIDAAGTFASILAAGTTGITINAGPSDVVTLRNLSINGAGTGIQGIHFVAGGALHIDKCVIFGFLQKGIFFEPNTGTRLCVNDTFIRSNNDPINGGAVLIAPGAAGNVSATFDGVRLERNLFGITANDRATVAIRNSVITGCGSSALAATAATALATIDVDSCMLVENSTGASANGGQARVRLSNVTIMNNTIGVTAVSGGVVFSFINNRIVANTTDGAPTSTSPQV
jgi:hypothetical protein